EGWVPASGLVPQEEARIATTLRALKVFKRPDLLALDGSKSIEPGTLLFALRTREQFSEVSSGGTATVWVQTSDLETGDREVQVSKLLTKARWMQEKNEPGHEELVA